ncbi:hypothetical protein [Psychrobacter urativorans]|uniref:hypothetical protein n=1 Tax=Psychrobacter urativorans TaxID=45610 RepID=UPI000B1CC603|nr:hypothetical protein [Psychrobacter urativorans]
MKAISSAKPSVLMAAIFAISAVAITGCSSDKDTKAVDRVDEAASLARVQELEARAAALKGNMPAATEAAPAADGSASTNASAKPAIKMPDISTIPDDEYGAAVKRGLQIANHTYKELPNNVGNQLNCTSCHLGNGSEAYAAPWNNMTSIYPVYRSRAGRVNVI